MGLVAIGRALVQRGAAALGLGGAQQAAGGAAGGLRSLLGSLFASPVAQGVGAAAATGGALALLQATGGGGGGAGGRGGFVTLEDGSMILVSANGTPARATLFLPAGAALPSGATVVSVSPNGQLFGIRKKRVKKTFAAEVARVKDTVKNANDLLNICKAAAKK